MLYVCMYTGGLESQRRRNNDIHCDVCMYIGRREREGCWLVDEYMYNNRLISISPQWWIHLSFFSTKLTTTRDTVLLLLIA